MAGMSDRIAALEAALAEAREALAECLNAMKCDDPSAGWLEIITGGDAALVHIGRVLGEDR